MKRGTLIRHLTENGCGLAREGSRHSVWVNLRTGAQTSVPRHREVDNRTAKTICGHLGIPDPPG